MMISCNLHSAKVKILLHAQISVLIRRQLFISFTNFPLNVNFQRESRTKTIYSRIIFNLYYEFHNFSQQNSTIFFFSIFLFFFMLKATFIMHTKPFYYTHTAKSVRRRRKIFILIFIPFKNSDRLRKIEKIHARDESFELFLSLI